MTKHYLSANDFLAKALERRKDEDAFRTLIMNKGLIDFCSNDYLGFARSEKIRTEVNKFIHTNNEPLIGSTGSRLLSGNSEFAEELERQIALYHNAAAGLLFNSGYTANIGLFSAIAKKGDTFIYDALIHASIHDGIRLSQANAYHFRHNQLNHLEERLKLSSGNVFVAVESVYSMDGDFADLVAISALCKQYQANLIVDEAHSTGLFGEGGKGRVVQLGLEQEVFARVHTFGKALGCHGAIVLGSEILRDYLINFSRPFIYTTAMPVHSLIHIKTAYANLLNIEYDILKTIGLTNLFKSKIKNHRTLHLLNSDSPIQCLIVSGNEKVKTVAKKLQKSGFDVRAILSPTVQKGQERLRICIHAFNTEAEIESLVAAI